MMHAIKHAIMNILEKTTAVTTQSNFLMSCSHVITNGSLFWEMKQIIRMYKSS